jgi:excisionase family DNA binding protein
VIERLYKPAEISFLLGVREQQVWRWVRAGKLRACRFAGGRWGRIRIPESAIREFLQLEEADREKPLFELAGLLPSKVSEPPMSPKAAGAYMDRVLKTGRLT